MNWYVFWLKPVFKQLEGKFILKTLKKVTYGVFLHEVSIGFYILVFLPGDDSEPYVLEPQAGALCASLHFDGLRGQVSNYTLSREHSKPSLEAPSDDGSVWTCNHTLTRFENDLLLAHLKIGTN